ncbi:Phospholipase/Carboxylesterase [Posidoniimonas corsicana]|uniref:Phospholipase/Carboxylesterase n=1 Tax=Posidoniimonas corsicana TaxID=1938618 RepID=A0A5C5VGY2_9BACT|nr:Phospholipase/Carboxylesterase [Posidoniimonas corsicana]
MRPVSQLSVVPFVCLIAVSDAFATAPDDAAEKWSIEWGLAAYHEYRGPRGEKRVLPYRLFPPRTSEGDNRDYPLVLWLHGHGAEPGDDNRSHVAHMDDTMYWDPDELGEFPFYVLAPQCPAGSFWVGDPTVEGEVLTTVMEIVDEVSASEPINPDRISVVGISSGGSAAWELAERFPERFAAVLPLGSGGGDFSSAKELSKTPIWAFHSKRDNAVPITGDRRTVYSVQSHGGQCALTETPGFGHDCWWPAFQQCGAREWLLLQERGTISSPPPGRVPSGTRWSWFSQEYLDPEEILARSPIPVAVIGVLAYLTYRKRYA